MSLLLELTSTRLELTGNAEFTFLLEAGASEEQLEGLLEDRKIQRPKWHKKLRNAKYYEQNKQKLLERAKANNIRRQQRYQSLSKEERQRVHEKKSVSAWFYRTQHKEILAAKEKERRARRKDILKKSQ
ncbi:hypothetical protein VKT23_010115 [Stygiomarasmius scandens]|uniref:Uncharacterized protein n=1 Tax=Marasmiellus scandens TaxID=2682957 RepID=A0ABR1JHW4_9AGAR